MDATSLPRNLKRFFPKCLVENLDDLCTVTKVDDEEEFLAFLDSLEKLHGATVRYTKSCLPRTYEMSIEGPNEEQFESDLRVFAFQVGWSVQH